MADDESIHPAIRAEITAILRHSRIHDLRDDGDEVARIADRVSRPLQHVHAVNGDPRELVIGYRMLAERAHEDCRTLLRIWLGV